MSKQTPNLKLFKYEKSVDGDKPFNIDIALNDNWEKIDKAFSVTNPDGSTTNIVEVVGSINDNINTVKESAKTSNDDLTKHINAPNIHTKIFSGTSDPDPSLGNDGDLYFKYE